MAPHERVGLNMSCPKCLKRTAIPRPDGDADDGSAVAPFPPLRDMEPMTPAPLGSPLPELNELSAELFQDAEAGKAINDFNLLDGVDVSGAPAADTQQPVPLVATSTTRKSPSHHELITATHDPAPLVATAKFPSVEKTQPTRDPRKASSQTFQTPRPRKAINRQLDLQRLEHSLDGTVQLTTPGVANLNAVAELSAAISMRMAPPPEPKTERMVIACSAAVAFATGVLIWGYSVLQDAAYLPFVLVVGIAMMVFSILWRAYITAKASGLGWSLLSILPPFCVIQLLRPAREYRLLPLMCFTAGTLLGGFFMIGADVKASIDTAFAAPTAKPSYESLGQTPLDRLKADYDTVAVLQELRTPETHNGLSDTDRAAILEQIQLKLESKRDDVRHEAFKTLVVWQPDVAKTAALTSLSEPNTPKADRIWAKEHVVSLGNALEADVVQLLKQPSETVQLTACELLEYCGGADALQALDDLAATTRSRAVRQEATLVRELLKKRLTGTK
jgi:hypothetical protein